MRSRAWIWLFSSTSSTIALSGGFRYNPTTSVSITTKAGSVGREHAEGAPGCGLRAAGVSQPIAHFGAALWMTRHRPKLTGNRRREYASR